MRTSLINSNSLFSIIVRLSHDSLRSRTINIIDFAIGADFSLSQVHSHRNVTMFVLKIRTQ